MNDFLKVLPIPILGAAITGWLCTSEAYGAIVAVVGDSTPPDIIATIQRWGAALVIIGTIAGALSAKAISGYWTARRQWQDNQDRFDDERKKRIEITAVQEVHDDQIKQVNAALRSPLASIAAPSEKPLSGIRPTNLLTTADIDHKTIGTP